ncbi:MAG: hypothetical protein IH835_07170, partial [Proteobacteria bacterium]|nr:hypothetical protein [Pseudomonadota bacterium]
RGYPYRPEGCPRLQPLGGAYDGLAQYQRAIEDLNEALRLDPELAPVCTNRAVAYTHLGELGKTMTPP